MSKVKKWKAWTTSLWKKNWKFKCKVHGDVTLLTVNVWVHCTHVTFDNYIPLPTLSWPLPPMRKAYAWCRAGGSLVTKQKIRKTTFRTQISAFCWKFSYFFCVLASLSSVFFHFEKLFVSNLYNNMIIFFDSNARHKNILYRTVESFENGFVAFVLFYFR
jgi:hypothetical protein